MPFSGPGGDYSAPLRSRYDRVMQLMQDDAARRALPRSGGGGRIDTSLLERDDERDRVRQQLAMTPGVRSGGSTATRPQSDSPLNVGSSNSFERFGETYSYDSQAAAEDVGSTEATKEAAAQRTRYAALQKMPGLSPREASRLVYGRGDQIDTDESRRVLAEFVRQPSRDTAASAVASGVSPLSLVYTSGANFESAIGARPLAPVPGTAEYRAMKADELAQRAEQEQRMIELRAKLTAENRPAVKSRTYRYVGDDKKVHVVDLDTGKEISESPTAVRPSTSDANEKTLRSLTPPVALTPVSKPGWRDTHWPGNRNAGATPTVAPVVPPVQGTPDDLSDDAIAGFIGGDAPAGAGGKRPSAQQLAQAKKDAGYKAWLVSKGYTVP